MRGSGWLLPIAALLVWMGAVAWPGAAAAWTALADTAPSSGESYVAIRPVWQLVVETGAYALAVALGAVLLGWAPGRVLGRAISGRSFVPLATLLLFPMCLPAYAVFYMWWQSWPADSALHAWAVEHGMLWAFKRATLVVSLLCWSWPIVAWCVAGSVALTPRAREEMLRLDGAGAATRWIDRARTDGAGLALGALLVFLMVFNNTTCFDLAEVFTFGNELRAKDALRASPADLLVTALPALAIAGAGAVCAWRLLSRPNPGLAQAGVRSALSTRVAAAAIWLLSVLVPFGLLARGMATAPPWSEFVDFYGRDAARSVGLAAISGAFGVVVALGLAAAWLDHRAWVRRLASVQAIGWLIAALVPGTIVGIGLEAAYNIGLPLGSVQDGDGERAVTLASITYGHPMILVVAHLARFGFVAALLARWISGREPRAIGDLRRSDDAGSLAGFLAAARPRVLAAGVGALAIVLVLALGEVVVTARINPPGSMPLAMTVLNDMHYQRPQTVILSILALVLAALAAALLATIAWAPLRRRPLVLLAVLLPAFVAVGCAPSDPTESRPLRPRDTFGSTGLALGQFSYPRCIAADPARETLYIIDKTARVQRFSFEGKPEAEWRMPEKENGKPTGVSVAPDGRVFVADTHYYRIIAFDPDGNELMRFGSYGEGPGEFIYPTHVAFGPEGRLYVSEYGGHDRVQVFSAMGEFLFEFGSFGSGDGEFSRPQSLLFDLDRDELYITDACNHRIVVTEPNGKVLRTIGTPGSGPGELHYPYGLMQLQDGSILVSEFGNNRVQRFSREGEPLGHLGRFGAGEGELRYPWGVAGAGGSVFVLDSGNNRVHRIRRPS